MYTCKILHMRLSMEHGFLRCLLDPSEVEDITLTERYGLTMRNSTLGLL